MNYTIDYENRLKKCGIVRKVEVEVFAVLDNLFDNNCTYPTQKQNIFEHIFPKVKKMFRSIGRFKKSHQPLILIQCVIQTYPTLI